MRRVLLAALVSAVLVVAPAIMPASTSVASADPAHALIQGSGSSWAANAINQWVADVQSQGLQVVFTPNGSAQGRKDFGYRTNDFAVSEIGFQGRDPLTGDQDSAQGRAYAYLPLVAGGTAFPYQIRVRGQLVRNLRLSGETLTKIFTDRITNWDDPEITADNNGVALPDLAIIPVVHSEGAGATEMITHYFASEFPSLWTSFAGADTWTEYFPRQGSQIAQNGSDGVMNFVTSAAANGAIGYDEYSYALADNYPSAKIGNAAGYFTLPTQYNVAVALTQAIINNDPSSPNYLLQDLSNVYGFGDPRTYVMSSYVYVILPIGADDQRMTTAKRQTLADFLYYSICGGQREIGPIGYSSLPINLVEAGFQQIAQLKAADPNVDLTQRDVSTCNNPTFIPGQPNVNYLAQIAPSPPLCDHVGDGPCGDDDTSRGGVATAGSGGGAASGAGRGAAAGAAAASGAGAAAAGAGSGTTTDPQHSIDAALRDPSEHALVSDTPAVVVAISSRWRWAWEILALLLLAVILVAPWVVHRRAVRHRAGSP
jgi:phosphate transport system substrate-binding protein